MDKLDGMISINLLTKPIDINLNEICFAVEVAVPNMFHDFTAGNKLRCPKQEQLEECKLSGCQRDCPFIARGAGAGGGRGSVRSPQRRFALWLWKPRRTSARTRARSSAKTKGFVR